MSDIQPSATKVVIPARFNGPPASGHGGYSAGAAAACVDAAAVEVRLSRPPPLEVPMSVERADGVVRLLHERDLVMQAREITLPRDVPEPASFEEAERATLRAEDVDRHPFPTCFGCGPTRAPGDGLRLFPSFVRGSDGPVACTFVPDGSLAPPGGPLSTEMMWAALDCPGAWAVHGGDFVATSEELGAFVTGTMAVEIVRSAHVGERLVVQGWEIGRERRKLYTGIAMFTADGELLAHGRQIWVVPRA